MDNTVKAKWLAALKGELPGKKYRKARSKLRSANGRMCCLGVLCDIQTDEGVEWHRAVASGRWYAQFDGVQDTADLPLNLRKKLGIAADQNGYLVELNDRFPGWSAVIDYIEKHL